MGHGGGGCDTRNMALWAAKQFSSAHTSRSSRIIPVPPNLHQSKAPADAQGINWGQHMDPLLANVVHVVGTKSRAAVTATGRIVAWRANDVNEPVSVLPPLPRRSLPTAERTSWIEWYPSKGKRDTAEDRSIKLVCGRCFVVAMRDNGEVWLATRQNKNEWGWHSVSTGSPIQSILFDG